MSEHLRGSNVQPFSYLVLKMYRRNGCFYSWLKLLIPYSVVAPRKEKCERALEIVAFTK